MTIPLNPGRSSAAKGPVTEPIRVMVVDDAIVVRGLLTRWIDEHPNLAVVATHRNGKLAVDDLLRSDPEVVVLDIEMPEMDGLTALPLMLRQKPDLVVVMASTLTKRNAEISLKALSLGATDYIPKPDGNRGVTTSQDFRRELVDKVASLGEQRRLRKGRPLASIARGVAPKPAAAEAARKPATAAPAAPMAKSSVLRGPAAALVIGSSTGGPQALTGLFAQIGKDITRLPVFIVQHMPPTFTSILAEHIAKASGRPAAEGQDGEMVGPGRIYVAPGGMHMTLTGNRSAPRIRIADGPLINYCKPAVDPLFESAAEIYGGGLLGMVLTGMGHDGAKGAKAIMNAGGQIIAQDEASSVVWGMPGAVVGAGAYSQIVPLNEIGGRFSRLQSGGRP